MGCKVLVFCGGEEWGWGVEGGRVLGGDVEGMCVDLFVVKISIQTSTMCPSDGSMGVVENRATHLFYPGPQKTPDKKLESL